MGHTAATRLCFVQHEIGEQAWTATFLDARLQVAPPATEPAAEPRQQLLFRMIPRYLQRDHYPLMRANPIIYLEQAMSDDQLQTDRVQQALNQAAEKKRDKLASRGKGRRSRSSEIQAGREAKVSRESSEDSGH